MKRTWKRNRWGNVVGYEGGRRVIEFGCQPWSERWAEWWCTGLTSEEAEYKALGVS